MLIWISFIALIVFFLALDLGVFHKDSYSISAKEALGWTAVWATISILFSAVVFWVYETDLVDNIDQLSSRQAVLKYLTGYVIELSLSLDNIFVIAMIFVYFKIPTAYQHRVLFWGILGAIVFRAIMIFVGVALIHKFSWMSYVFGALLLYSAYKMLTSKDTEIDPTRNPVVKLAKRFFPISKHLEGEHFFVKRKHIWAATPLFLTLLVIETTDILFAIDSIPAIFAITTDPFLVFSSNIFAILGLRSLYFVLASMLDRFHLLKYSLVFILAFVGVKMLLLHTVSIPEWLSLGVIIGSLLLGIVASLRQTKVKKT
ncbi:MAG: TerC family protein [Saprospiraceae bacterium]